MRLDSWVYYIDQFIYHSSLYEFSSVCPSNFLF